MDLELILTVPEGVVSGAVREMASVDLVLNDRWYRNANLPERTCPSCNSGMINMDMTDYFPNGFED